MPPESLILQIGSALAVGLMIGIQRGWQLRAQANGMRVAGIRTFSLIGLIAGISGYLAVAGFETIGTAILIATVTVIAIGYWRLLSADGKPDATSAIAAIATVALGFLGGTGDAALAVAGGAVVTLLLALRSELHGLVGALHEADVMAFARYAVIALAVFPFLPEGRFGPYDAWEPTTLWLVVVIVTGFSFLGYVANRIFGARRGTIATAIIGGAYSSTAVTQSFSQRLGSGQGGGAENAGIALATAVMYLRVIILVAILAQALLIPFVTLVSPALVVGLLVSYWLYRKAERGTGPAPPGNPIALVPAFGFVAFVAVAAVAARWAQSEFGEQGIAVLLLLMGSMDVDAAIITAGGLEPGTISTDLAALAVAGTILANMSVKLGVTVVYGKRSARPAAVALAASMVALAASLLAGYMSL
ncbi:MgtC/SapB family protein [Altererythrobacter sp. GH1-8]|uniref:MgtC/SapB family protein n=1 Tax=Altererythrobacter sp. GH1-8 TaxID=3349333 RepID=UPI00374D03ED